MSLLNDIRKTIQEIAAQDAEQRTNFFTAKVTEVEQSGEVCSIEYTGTIWSGVRLTAVTGNTNVRVRPEVGSYVMVVDLSNGGMTDLAVVMYSRFELIEMGEASHTMANADILHRELDKLTARVDTIIRAINTAVPTPQDGGAGLQTTMKAVLSTITQKENWEEIEDETIKH